MLRLKFDSKLDFQICAINSVVDIFKGQVKKLFDYTFQVVPNLLDLPKEKILDNLQEVQKRNGLPLSNKDDLREPYNFTIEMETGTGKTYIVLLQMEFDISNNKLQNVHTLRYSPKFRLRQNFM